MNRNKNGLIDRYTNIIHNEATNPHSNVHLKESIKSKNFDQNNTNSISIE